MALYSIEKEWSLGVSHSGSVVVDGSYYVDLTDEEVNTLVNLIKEKDSTDIDDLELEELYPKIYEKLYDAYCSMICEATESHWLMEAFDCGETDYDYEELKAYCKENCGFEFKYDEEEYLDEDGEFDEDMLYDDEAEAFNEWLDDYVHGLPASKANEFISEHMGVEIDLSCVDVEVEIPESIIEIAQK